MAVKGNGVMKTLFAVSFTIHLFMYLFVLLFF